MLHRLSGDPGRRLPARLRHHGARVLLLAVLATLVTLFFPPVQGMNMGRYTEGMVAQEDVIAQIPFSVPKTPAELERDRLLAMEAVPPTFDYVTDAADAMAAGLEGFFDAADSLVAAGDTLALTALLRDNQISATPSQVEYLLQVGSRAALRRAAQRAASELVPLGIADPARIEDLTTESITIRRDEREVAQPVAEVLTSRDFFTRAIALLPASMPPEARDLLRLILIRHIEYSLVLNVMATERDRDAASRSVQTTKADVLQGQAIVRAADPIGPQTLERLDAYAVALQSAGLIEEQTVSVGPLVGSGLVNFILLSLFGLLLYFSRPRIYANFRWLLLLAILTLAYFGAGVAIDRGGLAPEWLPIAFVALPVAVLWDTRTALILVFVLAAITATLPPFSSYGTVLAVMTGGAAAAMSVRAVRRRSETWVSIAIIAGAAGLMLLAHGLTTSRPLIDVAWSSAFFAGNATASALLAMGFLWVFELFTGITTDQTLLEWQDPARPLLRRLSVEAPGTYAHTISVANLSEAAATEIGANGLLCRVGVLYHDVGKMLKPHYFVENQREERNPHDKLKPETSAAIVREHVTEGARLARDANVPEVVVDFILEHHGTQKIGFFHEKAVEESDEEIDPTKFSYPGPKPRSKETAIVMLADSCESAARAMQEPTPDRVRELIEAVVASKIADEQLDDSPLTLRDVAQVKEQFVKILSGASHRRIEYPATKHLTDAEKSDDTEKSDDIEDGKQAPVEPEPVEEDRDASVAAGAEDGTGRSAPSGGTVVTGAGKPERPDESA